jgi:hypothetical protein
MYPCTGPSSSACPRGRRRSSIPMHAPDDTNRTVDYSFGGEDRGGDRATARASAGRWSSSSRQKGCSVAACDLNADTVAETVTLAGRPPAPWSPATSATSPPRNRCRGSATSCPGSTPACTSTWCSATRVSPAATASSAASSGTAGGMAARLCHPLLGRVRPRPGIPAAAHRQRRRRLGQHQRIERLRATYGRGKPGSATSTAEFAAEGFTEALIEGLRVASRSGSPS